MPAQIFIFEGASENTFGEYNITRDKYCSSASGEPIQYELRDPHTGHGVVVTGLFNDRHKINNTDCWMIGVSAIEDGNDLTFWTFDLRPGHLGNRNQLIVTAPLGAKLRCLNREAG